MNKNQRASKVFKILNKKYSDYPLTGLKNWYSPWQFLFCVILSARANDDQINKVTKKLFDKFKNLDDFANADIGKISKYIKSTGFYKVKSKYLKNCANKLISDFNKRTPKKLNDLITLPGVGRKTANVYQGVILGKSEGIAVDTHVARMSRRLKFTNNKSAEKIEEDLMKLFPKSKYHLINPIFFWHGRNICISRTPKCNSCELNKLCPSKE